MHAPLDTPSDNIEEFVSLAYPQYVRTALWSSLDDDGEPLDASLHTNLDATPARPVLVASLSKFCLEQWDIVRRYDPEQIAHDLWLTQNGHGCGFWDGDYPDDIGAALTAACENQTIDLYVHAGKIHA